MSVSLAVVGAGDRGSTYAGHALRQPDRARIVAVADPRPPHRSALADAHQVPGSGRYTSWQDVVA